MVGIAELRHYYVNPRRTRSSISERARHITLAGRAGSG